MTNKEWFKEAKFGMMVHWGLYALLAGEWRGKRMGEEIGEWAQSYFKIPIAEYSQLAKAFNPVFFNAEEWVVLAKEAGMKYIVVTSKHHEGFAMFRSKVDPYNVVDATPFKRDVIGEIAEACQKHNMKLGLYYSQDIDWHEPNGGGINHSYTPGRSSTNNWDFPDADQKNYAKCFENKIKPQMKEILTNYGELCLIWCDTPISISPEQSLELYNLIKECQPNCLVNSRIGNGIGDYSSLGDNEISNESFGNALVETPATLNDTWGYKSYDQNWKEAGKVLELKEHLNTRGINYLLNVGPDYLGRIPGPSQDILREVGRRLSATK